MNEIKNRFKYVNFELVESTGYWMARYNLNGEVFGYVEWYPKWNQWVFISTEEDTPFSMELMSELIGFIKQLEIPTRTRRWVREE